MRDGRQSGLADLASPTRACHHRGALTAFDLVLRGGLLVDGTGATARPADVGLLGDRILAVGDLSAVGDADVETVLDARGRVVAPGFIDPHGHSDGSVLVDGALASHLHQGYTTQLSGNCGDTLAPITDAGRELIALALRPNELVARWRSFGEYLERVEEQRLGPNLAFLVGHGTVRASVLGRGPAHADRRGARAMVGEVEAAMDAGAIGLSSGLIYAPGMHATAHEVEALVAASARHGGLYATHMRNECDDLFASLDESIDADPRRGRRRPPAGLAPQVRRRARSGARPAPRSSAWRRPGRGPRRRRRPVPVHGRLDEPRDDPAAGPAGSRRRGLRRGAGRPGRPGARPRRDGARDLGLGERGGGPGLDRAS